MVYVKIVLMILFNSVVLNVYANQKQQMPRGYSLEQLYLSNKDSKDQMMSNVKELSPLGDSQDYVPIIDPPVVRRIWIPAIESDADNQVLVSGHWVYVMLKESSWKK